MGDLALWIAVLIRFQIGMPPQRILPGLAGSGQTAVRGLCERVFQGRVSMGDYRQGFAVFCQLIRAAL